ncbi:MAG: glycosyltransferase [Verrucomicrobiota bacterium]
MTENKSSREFPSKWTGMKTALVHDWLTGMRGGERVLEILCDGFPEAPIHTLVWNPGSVSATINSHRVRTSFLQRFPRIYKHYRYFLPFFPAAIRRMPSPDADLMISTSHCVAKAHPHHSATKHLCYCFTPMRYAWQPRNQYFSASPIKAFLAAPLLWRLRRWDRRVSDGVDRFVAISNAVRARIRNAYNRDAAVVYPPVDLGFWTPGTGSGDGYDLMVSALVPYKRIELAISAYALSGRKLVIVGTGSEEQKLKAASTGNINFLGWQSDSSILQLYRNANMLVFPGEEDFGLVPIEAQACGTPVVAFRKGGALETVNEGETGVFFDDQTKESLNEAVQKALSIHWDRKVLRKKAEEFSVANFISGIAGVIDRL